MITYTNRDQIISALYNLQVHPKILKHDKYGECRLQVLRSGLLYISWGAYDKESDGVIEMGVATPLDDIEKIDIDGGDIKIRSIFSCTRDHKYSPFQVMSFIGHYVESNKYNLLESDISKDMTTSTSIFKS